MPKILCLPSGALQLAEETIISPQQRSMGGGKIQNIFIFLM